MTADFAQRHGRSTKVRIAARAMTTDTPITFEAHDMMRLVGYDMAKAAAMSPIRRAACCPSAIRATDLAQCFELTQQLRGNAGARQVEGARASRCSTTSAPAGPRS